MTTANPYSGEPWAEVADDPAAVDDAVRVRRVRAFEDSRVGPRCRLRERAARDAQTRRALEAETPMCSQQAENQRQRQDHPRDNCASKGDIEVIWTTSPEWPTRSLASRYRALAPNFLVYTERVPKGVIGTIVPMELAPCRC